MSPRPEKMLEISFESQSRKGPLGANRNVVAPPRSRFISVSITCVPKLRRAGRVVTGPPVSVHVMRSRSSRERTEFHLVATSTDHSE